MSTFTYTDIYQNVVNEIKKRIAFTTGVPYGNQLDRAQTFSASTEPGRTTSGLIETIQVIQDLLMNSIPGVIREGLNVVATSPISSSPVPIQLLKISPVLCIELLDRKSNCVFFGISNANPSP